MLGALPLLKWLPLGVKLKSVYGQDVITKEDVDDVVRDVVSKLVNSESHPRLTELLSEKVSIPTVLQQAVSSEELLAELQSLLPSGKAEKGSEMIIRTCPHCDKLFADPIGL
jgi:hypothetical protein